MLSGLYFVYILTRATLNPSIAPPMTDAEIDLRPSRPANVLLFFGMAVGLLVLTVVPDEVQITGGEVNWALFAFLCR